MKKYEISVATVSFNDFEGLKNTEKSVLRLKRNEKVDIEWLVADGGSTDGTVDYLKNNNVLDVYIPGPDNGIYDGMNKLLDAASGDYIIFMNAGDYFSPAFNLHNLLPFLGVHDFISGYSCQIFLDDVYIRPKYNKESLLFKFPAHQSVFVSKKYYKRFIFNEKLKISADYDWMAKIQREAKSATLKSIVSVFELGGISNAGDFKCEFLKLLESKSITCFYKFFVKQFLIFFLGKKLFYRVIYFWKYRRLNFSEAEIFGLL